MSSAIEVRVESASEIAPDLRDELQRWSDLEFGQIPYRWAPAQWYAAARVDGQLAGSLTIVTREMKAGGEGVRVAGIGNVVTKLEHRLQGVASAMLRAAADLMRSKLNVEFGLLICQRRVAPVYAKARWMRVEGPTRFSQPSGTATIREIPWFYNSRAAHGRPARSIYAVFPGELRDRSSSARADDSHRRRLLAPETDLARGCR